MSSLVVRTVFVAGPYQAESPELILRNVRRACAVGALATRHGLSPFVAHPMGLMGVYGDCNESTPTVRERAISCGELFAERVALFGGDMWIIALDDGSLTAGTQRELAKFRAQGLTDTQRISVRPWQTWARQLKAELRDVELAPLQLGDDLNI